MHILIAFLTIITLVLSGSELLLLVNQAYSRPQRTLQLIAVYNLILAIGNTVTVFGYGSSGCYSGLIMSYFGTTYLGVSYIEMFSSAFHEKKSDLLKYISIVIGAIFLALILLDSRNHFIYSSIAYDVDSLVSERYATFSTGYYLYMLWQFSFFVWALVLTIRCYKRRRSYFISMKKSIIGFLACGAIAYVTPLVSTVFNLHFDLLPYGMVVSTLLLILIFYYNKVYPIGYNIEEDMLDSIDDAMVAYDSSMRLIYANSKAHALLELSEDSVYGTSVTHLSERLDTILNLENGEMASIGEAVYRNNILKLCNSRGEYAQIIWLHDITREENDIEKAINSSEEAKRENIARGVFLANMSHEIRTPVNAMLGMDEMILRENWDDNISGYAMNIMRAGRTLLSIINDILDYSRIESGEMTIECHEYNLSQMLRDIILMIRFSSDKKNLKFRVNVDGSLPVMAVGDEDKVRQIILNALSSAVKYTNEGSVEFNVSPGSADDGRFLLNVTIRDTGVGMQKDEIVDILSGSNALSQEYKNTKEGSGIGPAIAKRMAEMMDGEIHIEDNGKKGTVVTIVLPQNFAADKSEIGEFDENSHIPVRRDTGRVKFKARDARLLIVDDNGVNRALAKALLKDTEIKAHEVDCGEKCLEAIRNEAYDLILMDHRMPGLSGVDTLELMNKDKSHRCVGVPVIIMTADVGEGRKTFFLKKGFADYIPKPMNPVEYEKMVLKYLPTEKVTLT